MKLSQYGYEFSQDMIAKYPTTNRDDARLLVLDRKTGNIEHRIFKDIIEYFDEKDMFVFNDTKVFPARLMGCKEKTGADIEIFLLRELNRELRLCNAVSPEGANNSSGRFPRVSSEPDPGVEPQGLSL